MTLNCSWSALLARDDDQSFSLAELPIGIQQALSRQCYWITNDQIEAGYRPIDPILMGANPSLPGLLMFEKQPITESTSGIYSWQWLYVQSCQDWYNHPVFVLRPTRERLRQLGLDDSLYQAYVNLEYYMGPQQQAQHSSQVGPGLSPPLTDTPAQCDYTRFAVHCDHQGRTFTLDSAHDSPNDGSRYVFQVIAQAGEPDRIILDYQGQCRGTDYANPDCGGFEVTGPNLHHTYHQGTTFKVYAPKINHQQDFEGFLQHLLLPNQHPHQYKAQPISCYNRGKASAITIEAYPKVAWQSDLSLGSEVDNNRNVNWGLEGNIQVSCNQDTYKLGADSDTPLNSLFQNVQEFMNEVLPYLGCLDRYSQGALSIKAVPPSIKLLGQLKNIENPQGYNVDYEGDIKLKLDPLFALEGDVDIVQWIIDCFPETKAASFLSSIIGDGSSEEAGISVKLSCQDRIEGHSQWSKAGQDDWQTDYDLANELTLSIVGDVEASADLFFFKVGAGASLRFDSGIKIDSEPAVINDSLALKPKLEFNGLTVHWAYHVDFSSGGNHSPNRKSFGDKEANDKLEGKEVRHSILISPKTWPKDNKPIYLSRGIL